MGRPGQLGNPRRPEDPHIYQESEGENFVFNPLADLGESRLSDNGRRALSMSADTDVAENLTSSFVLSRVGKL